MIPDVFRGIVLALGLLVPVATVSAQDVSSLSPTPPAPSEADDTVGTTQAAQIQTAYEPDVQTLEERIARLESARLETAWQPTAEDCSSCGMNFGYDSGFFFEYQDAQKDQSFKMKFSVRTQFRYSYFASDGPNRSENNFEIERVRPKWQGHIFDPKLEYELQLDIDNDDADRTELYNAFLRYDMTDDLCLENEVALKVGLWKMNMFRQEYTSDGRQMLVDRSMANEFFNIDHSVAMALEGHRDILGMPSFWHVAVLNGFDTDRDRPGRTGALDRNFAYLARMQHDLAGEWGKDEESDLAWHDCPAVRVGWSFANTRVDSDGAGELTNSRLVDSGARLTDTLAGLDEFDLYLYGVDAGYKNQGLSVLTEFYFRHIMNSNVPGTFSKLFDYGYYVQAGYFVLPKKLELVTRYSSIIGDSGSLGGADASADEAGGGLNWYIQGHNLKFQFDVLRYNGAPVSSSSAQLRPGDDGVLYRGQLQWLF